jgi:hypothetical protein
MARPPVRVRGYLDAADTNATLAAVRTLGALVEVGPDEVSSAAGACARPASPTARSTWATPGRSCACCPGGSRAARARVHARRRRLDPPPAVDRIVEAARAHGRHAAGDRRALRPVHGDRRAPARDRLRAPPSRARRSSRACCSPRSSPTGRRR